MRNFKTILYLLLLTIIISCSHREEIITTDPIPPIKEEKEIKKIVVVAISDTHGRIMSYDYGGFAGENLNGFAKISTFIKNMRDTYPNLLLFDLGDSYFYEPFVKERSPSIIPVLNYLGVDLYVMGNHEMYLKNSILTADLKTFNGRVVTNNVSLEKDSNSTSIFPPSTIFDVEGIKIAVTGSTVQQKGIRKFLLSYEYDIADPVASSKAAVNNISDHYDALVGGYHMLTYGGEDSAGVDDIVREVPQFDLMINGHMHTRGIHTVEETNIIVNGAYGNTAIYSELIFSREDQNSPWKLENIIPHLVDITALEGDPEFIEKFQTLHKETIEYENKRIKGWEQLYNSLQKYIIP